MSQVVRRDCGVSRVDLLRPGAQTRGGNRLTANTAPLAPVKTRSSPTIAFHQFSKRLSGMHRETRSEGLADGELFDALHGVLNRPGLRSDDQGLVGGETSVDGCRDADLPRLRRFMFLTLRTHQSPRTGSSRSGPRRWHCRQHVLSKGSLFQLWRSHLRVVGTAPGGTTITITGKNLAGVSAVSFGRRCGWSWIRRQVRSFIRPQLDQFPDDSPTG